MIISRFDRPKGAAVVSYDEFSCSWIQEIKPDLSPEVMFSDLIDPEYHPNPCFRVTCWKCGLWGPRVPSLAEAIELWDLTNSQRKAANQRSNSDLPG